MRVGLGPVAGVLTTASTLLQLLLSPVIGLADNGDYKRVLSPLHLVAEVPPGAPRQFQYLWLHYVPGSSSAQTYASTEVLLARLVHWLDPGPDLDVRAMGLAHAVLLGVAVWLIVRALPGPLALRTLTAALLVVVLTDTRLVVYLQSFYTEPSSLLALLLVVAAVLHAWRRETVSVLGLLAMTAAAAALVVAKSQNAPLVLPLAVLLVARRSGRGRWLPAVLAGCLVVLSVGYLQRQPARLADSNRYNAVFVELLGSSADPAADLRELGIDPGLVAYAGRAIYQSGNATKDPRFGDFFETVTTRRIAQFYVDHPGRALSLARRGASASAELVPRGISPPLGTRTWEPGVEPYADTCKLCLFSSLSRGLRGAAPVLLPLLWLAAVAAALRLRGYGGLAPVLLLLASCAALSTAVALLAEGEFEIVKHLYLASVCNGLLAVLLVHAVGCWRTGAGPAYLPRHVGRP